MRVATVVMAELPSGPALLRAVAAMRAAGVSRLDAYTPYEVPGLDDALGVTRSPLGWIVLAAGLAGGAAAYALEWWINVVDEPLNIGGRAEHSPLAFVPIAFEMAMLCAAVAALVSALGLGGLPRLWHPVDDIEGFDSATRDGFWLSIDAGDPALDRARDEKLLVEAGARRVVWP